MPNNITEKLIEFIIENYSEENSSLFYSEFYTLKKYSSLFEVNELYLEKLINLERIIKDNFAKLSLIEVIAEFDSFEYDNYEFLLNDYIEILAKTKISDIEGVHQCLNALVCSGADPIHIIERVYKKLDKKKTIEVLIGLDNDSDFIPSDLVSICNEIDIEARRRYRVGVISSFILLTNPLCSKYDNIFCVSSSYPSYITAAADYAWRGKESTDYIVYRKIVSKREAEILEKLGELLYKNDSINEEESINLYNEFFNGLDPYKVMFTLP